MEYWTGNVITSLKEDEIFVFGSNPSGIHGAGAAKAAMAFGATYGNGRGISGQSYALITKNLKAGFVEKATGITYEKDGYCSVSREQIIENIKQMYELAKTDEYKNKKFLISYQYETWPNGNTKKSLNGYTSDEIFAMFTSIDIPQNIFFHESYKNKLEEKLKSTQNVNYTNTDKNTSNKDYTFFFYLTSPFSNFHPAKFTYKDYKFSTTEQFMMFCKAKLFNDEVIAQKIMDVNNLPLVQKFLNGEINRLDIINNKELCSQWNEIQKGNQKLGRQVKNYDDIIWNNKRFNIVRTGLKEKFKQNKELGEVLLKTKNSTLVEASPYDKIWGIGLSANDAKKTPEENWPGQNLLGQALEQVRNYLTHLIPNIEVCNFYHLGKKIPENGVYIGRYNKEQDLQASIFANPFKLSAEEERGATLERFENYLYESIASNKITKKDLMALNNKKLVCYCSPKGCHGDVIKKIVTLLLTDELKFDEIINNYKNKNKMKI